MTKKKPLGELLIEAGRINETQLAAALHSQRTWGGKLGSTLVRMGFVREEDILRCLSAQLRLPSVDFRKVNVSPRALHTVPIRIAEKYNVIPVAIKEELGKKSVILAMSDATNLDAISEIEFQTGVNIRPVVAAESSITRAIDRYYRGRKVKEEYGYEKLVDLTDANGVDEMVIIRRGDEEKVSTLEGHDAVELIKVLIDVLEEKGVIDKKELEEALRGKT
jgi:type IV pilus assembly protein PilB